MSEPNTPVNVYKALIDQLVDETRLLGSSAHVAKNGFFSKAPAHSEFNDFIKSLSPQERQLLSQMLQEERDSTIHDVLAALTWWVTAHEVDLVFKGKSMPIDLSGMGLHGDFVGRKDGWEWPERNDGNTA